MRGKYRNSDALPQHVVALRWLCRIFGMVIVVLAGLTMLMWMQHPPAFNISNGIRVFFFGCMLAGFVIGWKWEGLAGILIITGYLGFLVLNRLLWSNWMLTMFPLIGIGYLYTWKMTRNTSL